MKEMALDAAITRKKVEASTKEKMVRKMTAPTFPKAPVMPAICPVIRRWMRGTMANTAPEPDCTKKEQHIVARTAKMMGHELEIWLIVRYPTARPTMKISILFLLPMRSLISPPAGRAMRFINANPDAIRPAVTGVSENTSMKNMGNMEMTASSEPKDTK